MIEMIIKINYKKLNEKINAKQIKNVTVTCFLREFSYCANNNNKDRNVKNVVERKISV